MIIKKFQAESETEAILKAKEEMGSSAIVLNIKTIKHRGITKIFKKDMVEVTAALEDKPVTGQIPTKAINYAVDERSEEPVGVKKTTVIEEKLNNLQSMLENQIHSGAERTLEEKKEKSINFTFIQLIYNQMLDNEVDEKYANQIVGEIETSLKKESNLDNILSGVYQKIILKLGQPHLIELDERKSKLVFFIGPTGVGKTTTIAKLASKFKLDQKAKVAMITSDTYRIAAVEQLRTYANILDIPLKVVYTIDELNDAVQLFKEYDLILVDTAGRSHKNAEQCSEMIHLIQSTQVHELNMEKEVYLVLSAATKYKDLIKIANVYNQIPECNLIFTKLDETTSIGNILNMKLQTGSSLSYVTSGQTVPDDICAIDAQKVAKQILGGTEH